jgi:hypothetical protein
MINRDFIFTTKDLFINLFQSPLNSLFLAVYLFHLKG